MKLKEIIIGISDCFYDVLYEMAFSRSDLEKKITEKSIPVVEHLIKVLKWNDEFNYKKHLRDIENWISEIQMYKLSGNKRLKQRDYFEWMCIDVVQDEKNIKRWIKRLYRYHELKELNSDEEVYNKLVDIMQKISKDLSTNSFDNIQDYF